jgi:tellurite resistance protein TerC
MHKFRFLKIGISIVLIFVGVKMLLSSVYVIPVGISLVVIAGILALTVAISWRFPAGE